MVLRKILFAVIMITVLGVLPNDSWSKDPIAPIKIAYEVGTTHPKGIWAADFKAKAEELSAGRLKVEIFPNAQLFPSEQATFEAVSLGVVQMSLPASSHLASFNPKFDVFNLGYLIPSMESLYKLEDSAIGKEMLTSLLTPKGVRGLGWANNVPLMVFGTKKGYVKLADFRGAKIRISGGPTREANFKALGASTVSIPAAELFLAAQQGVIDGALSSITFIATSKLYEVFHHVTRENLVAEPYPVVMNLAAWNKLPDDLKKIVQQSADYAQEQNRIKLDEMVADAFKTVEQNKMQIHKLSPEDAQAWKAALKKVEEKVAPIIGQEWIDRIKSFIAKNS